MNSNKIVSASFKHPARKHQKVKWKASAYCLFAFVVIVVLAGYDFSSKEKSPVLKKCHGADLLQARHFALSEFFRRKGSPAPQMMATAVLETKRPLLMASIAVRESGGDPKAVGDGGKSRGAFQCQPRHWSKLMHEGKVSSDPITQALDSERILEEFIAANNGDLKVALNKYGGDVTKKTYGKSILKEAKLVLDK